jgi:hypothetical protein
VAQKDYLCYDDQFQIEAIEKLIRELNTKTSDQDKEKTRRGTRRERTPRTNEYLSEESQKKWTTSVGVKFNMSFSVMNFNTSACIPCLLQNSTYLKVTLLALPFDDATDTTKGVLSIEEAYDMVMVPDSRSGFMRISRLISGSTRLGSMSLKKRTLSNASLALLQQSTPNK